MPLFLIEFYDTEEAYEQGNIACITGADTIDELIQKLDKKAYTHRYAKVFILRRDAYIRILTADLKQWREIVDEEKEQENNNSLY